MNQPFMRCKNCKHWDEAPDTYYPLLRCCNSRKADTIEHTSMGGFDGAMIASFMTGPEFGCIHFEERK